MKVWMFVLTMGLVAWLQAAPAFVGGNPTLTQVSGTWTVDFTLSESTDVEISIVNVADSSVVRHLAAGMLGANAPAPLVKSSLHQTVTWDGKDDLGRTVTVGASIRARVRAGMSAKYDKMVDRGEKGQNSAYTAVLPTLGLAVDNSGNLVVANQVNTGWPHGPGQLSIRAYDAATGDYRKTLFPFAPGLDKSALLPYGLTDLGGNLYQTKTVFLPYPVLSFRPITPLPNISGSGLAMAMSPVISNNSYFICNYPYDRNPVMGFVEMAPNGTYQSPGSLPFITNYSLPPLARLAGPLYFYPLPDGQHMLMSGLYHQDTDTLPVDTGFWRDGRVFKVNRTTGVASIFIELNQDSMPKTTAERKASIGPQAGPLGNFAAIHGMAVDDSGRVFICDRLHGQIGVYSSTGAFLKGIPVAKPDLVEVNRRTGELYVTNRNYLTTGTTVAMNIRISKFSDWRGASPSETAFSTVTFTNTVHPTYVNVQQCKAVLAVAQNGAVPVLWYACGYKHIVGFRDEGSALTQFKNFADSSDVKLFNFDRVAVDRKKETVYLQNGWDWMFKVEDMSRPVIVPCSTSARKRITAGDMQVSPDGFLYIRWSTGGTMNGGWNGPIFRYTTDHLHAPAKFIGRDTNYVTWFLGKYGAGFMDRGFDITTDGRLALMEKHTGRILRTVDTNGVNIDDSLLWPLPANNTGGVQFDLKGDLYIGALIRDPVKHVTPAGFTTDTAYRISVGSIVKFDSRTGGSIDDAGTPTTRQAHNALKVYSSAGFAPFSGSHPMSGQMVCICRTPKFDVDPYGRLFIPNAITGKVAVVDNEDNLIVRMGEYGNYDSRGPGIPLIWPIGVATSEDFMYITDMVNERLLRVQMDFALDNYPGLTLKMGSDAALSALPFSAVPGLFTSPNPFSGTSRIAFNLNERSPVTLTVHDLSGRVVTRLVSGVRNAGVHAVRWNGRNTAGHPVAPGVYVYRLEAGERVLTCRAILVK